MKNPFLYIKKQIKTSYKRFSKDKHHSFKMTPRQKQKIDIKASAEEGWRLAIESVHLIFQNKKIFLPLIAIYSVMLYLLVGGVAQSDYTVLKEEAIDMSDGIDAVTTAVAYFGSVITGGLSSLPTELQQFLGGMITIIFWLTTTWSARMLIAKNKIKLRDAFYNAPTPLISTLCVLLVVALQLIPAAIGLFSLTSSITEGWITNLSVALAFGSAALLLVLLSLYWISGSIVSIGIVSLPGMYPMQAIREAREITYGKRWSIMMRIITVLVLLLIVWAFILIPIFFIDNWLKIDWLPLVPVVVQIVLGFSIIFLSTYVYKLYRSLL